MTNPSSAPPRRPRNRRAESAAAAYLCHRSDCPLHPADDGTAWRALTPAGAVAALREWHIPLDRASSTYQANTPLSLLLSQGAGLIHWQDASQGQPLESALVPGDVLQFPAGTQFRFHNRATCPAIFFMTGDCRPIHPA
ncbi:hypothetical protein [Halothiobacillus sp. DCM-1]|uniref:hypothetical protein n=1 Tax=Halothiobacillus sp. DCM-1 TaxID=3112558 RepID=UPI00324908E3